MSISQELKQKEIEFYSPFKKTKGNDFGIYSNNSKELNTKKNELNNVSQNQTSNKFRINLSNMNNMNNTNHSSISNNTLTKTHNLINPNKLKHLKNSNNCLHNYSLNGGSSNNNSRRHEYFINDDSVSNIVLNTENNKLNNNHICSKIKNHYNISTNDIKVNENNNTGINNTSTNTNNYPVIITNNLNNRKAKKYLTYAQFKKNTSNRIASNISKSISRNPHNIISSSLTNNAITEEKTIKSNFLTKSNEELAIDTSGNKLTKQKNVYKNKSELFNNNSHSVIFTDTTNTNFPRLNGNSSVYDLKFNNFNNDPRKNLDNSSKKLLIINNKNLSHINSCENINILSDFNRNMRNTKTNSLINGSIKKNFNRNKGFLKPHNIHLTKLIEDLYEHRQNKIDLSSKMINYNDNNRVSEKILITDIKDMKGVEDNNKEITRINKIKESNISVTTNNESRNNKEKFTNKHFNFSFFSPNETTKLNEKENITRSSLLINNNTQTSKLYSNNDKNSSSEINQNSNENNMKNKTRYVIKTKNDKEIFNKMFRSKYIATQLVLQSSIPRNDDKITKRGSTKTSSMFNTNKINENIINSNINNSPVKVYKNLSVPVYDEYELNKITEIKNKLSFMRKAHDIIYPKTMNNIIKYYNFSHDNKYFDKQERKKRKEVEKEKLNFNLFDDISFSWNTHK